MPALVGALVVVAAMLIIADSAAQRADRAQQAQLHMERVRVLSTRLDALTWRGLATRDGAAQAIAIGASLYRGMTENVRALRVLGVSRRRIAAIEDPLGELYAAGLEAAVTQRTDDEAGRRLAESAFSPTIDRLNAELDDAAREQDAVADAARARGRRASLASVAGGLALLSLLGWRVHTVRRRNALEAQARAAERRGEQRLRALVRHSSDVVAVIDEGGKLRWMAESVERMLGYTVADLADVPLGELVHPDDVHRTTHALGDLARRPGAVGTLGLRVRAADGRFRHLEAIAENHLGDPDIGGVLLNLRDVSERVALERRLRHQAFHDSLTGLANRSLFEDRLAHALERTRRHGARTAVVFVDVDDFKTVNDSLGHVVGDDLLRTVSRRLHAALREQDTAARLGGDEFAVLLEDLGSDEEAMAIAERVRVALEEPVTLAGRHLTPTASIGVALPGRSTTAADALGNADVAMYAAKERGKGQVAAFEPSMRERVVERLDLTGDLTTAIERGELVIEYQPVVALGSGTISGVEALIRWEHPTRGRLGPDRFIGLAESTGLIVPIGLWVLETACADLRRWDADCPEADLLGLSVNVSARQLADPGFAGDVRAVLEASGVAPGRVTLEITEHALVDDSEAMQRQLAAVKAIGVRLAVDDFGTGYSALSYLQVFPIDVLKVDRSFVAGIDHDIEKARLVRGIVEMGNNLRLAVVAEGIEEEGEAALLRDFRSGYGQGYLFSRPVGADAIPALVGSAPALTAAPR